ncbi:MAG: protein phosphatase 2C domain-containing protein [Acidimicrobiia bacterium]|nr:MAG: protein phosphatase 2C domain-containing protein [Acidimicrobiia bacterium]
MSAAPLRFRWATRTDTGLVRDQNEDAVFPDPGTAGEAEHLVAAVADGMGGHAGGEIASAAAIEAVATVSGPATIRVNAANLAVQEAAAQRPRLSGMGTTLTLAIFDGDGTVEVGHVGDSRAYLLHDGSLTRITADHSFVAEMMAAGRMTQAEAEAHPYRSVLTRAVGLEHTVEVDVFEHELAAGDRVLICSDGVTALLEDEEILRILTEHDDPEGAADALVAAANAAGGIDNVTVAVVDATPAGSEEK